MKRKLGAAVALLVIVPLIFIIIISSRPFAAACGPSQPLGEPAPGSGDTANPVLDRVVAISVDGLSVAGLQAVGPQGAPHIYRLLNNGASTLNARTMVEQTVTLPNHVSMITGRRIDRARGGHGVTWNTDRADGPTVQDAARQDVASVFSVAGSAGDTAVFSTKAKFAIFKHSWPRSVTRSNIYDQDDARVAAEAAADLRDQDRVFTFVHFGLPDETGHHEGWDSAAYRDAIRRVDRYVGQVLAAARTTPQTAVILTADHGGHGPAHSDAHDAANYTIPFAVDGPGIPAGDLYRLNPDYRDPRRTQPGYDGAQPVRNGDVANLALSLLGLRPVPGSIFGTSSTLNVAQATEDQVDDDPAATGEVLATLTRIHFGAEYPAMSEAQARNAITIGQVARELEVPTRGLQVAIAAAIQESKLDNLDSGDRDSLGLFQQRPSSGWGTPEQITTPRLAALAFFGRAEHTDNPGLLDIPGWQNLSITEAAQAVQSSGHPDAYAEWETAAGEIASVLDGGTLPTTADPADPECLDENGLVNPITLASFNILGAGHTDGNGGHQKHGYPSWDVRLENALSVLERSSVTVAGLQEVHPPQEHALATRYSSRWGMWPKDGGQNKVIWDAAAWAMTDAQRVPIPYFGGNPVGMPLVQLTSRSTGQVVWLWSIHNPASTRGNARGYRAEALRRQLDTMRDLKDTGVPVFIVGDFNDGRDGASSSHCRLTPTLTNAFGGQSDPCRPPHSGAPIDHIYGGNVTFASANVDGSVRARKISDHPLVTATTEGSSGCPPTGSPAEEGLTPDGLLVLRSVNAQFGPHAYLGIGERSSNPDSDHPAGRAVDVMIDNWSTENGVQHGNRIAEWVRAHAVELGVTYVIWRRRIWNVGDEGWSPYTHPSGQHNETLDHLNHVHVSVAGTSGTRQCDAVDAGQVVYPVPPQYVSTDNHSWHDTGPNWSRWHTGTDFSVSCGVPVLAAHAGVVQVDPGNNGWAGPNFIKISTGPNSLTTWYAHMQTLSVRPGDTVRPGQQIGQVGALGNVTGCHLHFEVHLENGSIYGPDNVDPTTWLAQQTGSNA